MVPGLVWSSLLQPSIVEASRQLGGGGHTNLSAPPVLGKPALRPCTIATLGQGALSPRHHHPQQTAKSQRPRKASVGETPPVTSREMEGMGRLGSWSSEPGAPC